MHRHILLAIFGVCIGYYSSVHIKTDKAGDFHDDLLTASLLGHNDVVKLLLEYTDCTIVPAVRSNPKPEIFAVHSSGRTRYIPKCSWNMASIALILACTNGKVETAKTLMDRSTVKTDHIDKAARYAIEGKHWSIVKLFLEYGWLPKFIDPNIPLELIRSIIDHGYSVHADDGSSLLDAVTENKIEVVKLLIDLGCDPTVDYDILHRPCLYGEKEMIVVLLSSNFFSDDIKMFLRACSQGNMAVIESMVHKVSTFILECGAFCSLYAQKLDAHLFIHSALTSAGKKLFILTSYMYTLLLNSDAQFLSGLAESGIYGTTFFGKALASAYDESLDHLGKYHGSLDILHIVVIAAIMKRTTFVRKLLTEYPTDRKILRGSLEWAEERGERELLEILKEFTIPPAKEKSAAQTPKEDQIDRLSVQNGMYNEIKDALASVILMVCDHPEDARQQHLNAYSTFINVISRLKCMQYNQLADILQEKMEKLGLLRYLRMAGLTPDLIEERFGRL